MSEILEARREKTTERLAQLRAELTRAAELAGDKACVYVNGSFGRLEASAHSDLDLFIVGKGTPKARELRRLDEICIKADLINVTAKLNIPEFSGDGEYLVHYTVADLVDTLGDPQDDARNTFTARLLLLLESKPLLSEQVYRDIRREVIAAYWRDHQDHSDAFVPAFLANDVLRLWRTFCVNYEARTQAEPAEKKAKRKLKNYKLKHSRLLTCYSALLHMLKVYGDRDTVHPEDCEKTLDLTPTERLQHLAAESSSSELKASVERLLARYETFLSVTDAPESELVQRFMDKESSAALMKEAREFGQHVWDLMDIVGQKNRFHRLLVV